MKSKQHDYYVLLNYVLDSICDENRGGDLSLFLSDANPFLFKGLDSADPAVYDDFEAICKEHKNDLGNGYKIAKDFVNKKCPQCVKDAFSDVTEEEWEAAYNICFG